MVRLVRSVLDYAHPGIHRSARFLSSIGNQSDCGESDQLSLQFCRQSKCSWTASFDEEFACANNWPHWNYFGFLALLIFLNIPLKYRFNLTEVGIVCGSWLYPSSREPCVQNYGAAVGRNAKTNIFYVMVFSKLRRSYFRNTDNKFALLELDKKKKTFSVTSAVWVTSKRLQRDKQIVWVQWFSRLMFKYLWM